MSRPGSSSSMNVGSHDLDLVWSGIADNLSSITSIWWEHGDIVDKLNVFRRVRYDRLILERKNLTPDSRCSLHWLINSVMNIKTGKLRISQR